MFPVGLICISWKNLVLDGTILFCPGLALTERKHRFQSVISLIMQFFRVFLVFSSHNFVKAFASIRQMSLINYTFSVLMCEQASFSTCFGTLQLYLRQCSLSGSSSGVINPMKSSLAFHTQLGICKYFHKWLIILATKRSLDHNRLNGTIEALLSGHRWRLIYLKWLKSILDERHKHIIINISVYPFIFFTTWKVFHVAIIRWHLYPKIP